MAVALETLDTIPTTANHHWEIDYSRFFEFPRTTLNLKSTGLSPLLKSTITRFNGTWLSSSSPASLFLFLSYPLSDVALVVTLDDAVYEEHLISTLQFSWPQVSCLSRPTRGSRVVFATYRDKLGQSFNVKLTGVFIMITVAGPEVCIEESLKNSWNNIGLEVACQSDRVTYGRSIYRSVALGSSNPLRNNSNMGLPSLNLFSRGMMAGPNAEDTLALLPSTEPKQDKDGVGFKNVHEVIDLKSYSPRCMLDSSIHDVLYNIEKVIVELGGDLSI